MHWTLRWVLLAILNRFWPVDPPSEEELIRYGREQERQSQPDLPVALIGPVTPPVAPLPQKLNLPTGQWRSQFFIEVRPDLYKPPRPHVRKVEPVPEIERIPTKPVGKESTEKYKALPKFLTQ